VITVSKYLQNAMKSCDLEAKRWEIITKSVDDKRFRPDTSHTKSEKCRMFHISCFEDKSKNISGILNAIALLSEKRTDFEVVMIGDGIDFLKIKELSRQLQIEKFVQFVGVLEGDELISTINSCDFMVLFSNYETFGTVVLESFSCGKPVIVSNGGALPEITPEKYGKIVPVKNVEKLSQAMFEMIDDYKIYSSDEMAEFVSEHYSVESVGFALNKLYQSIFTT
jgi:glycosyltransferase involved in cell wall biosynthesis